MAQQLLVCFHRHYVACVRNRRGGSCPAFTVSSDPCPPPLIQRTLSGWHQTRCGFPGPGPSPHSLSLQLKRIGMDLIGPLERSAHGHRFALVLVDYATRYPEAVPLRTISAKSVADALFRIISRVGIRKRFSLTRARRLCHVRYANYINRWALNRFAPVSITHKRTACWKDLTTR